MNRKSAYAFAIFTLIYIVFTGCASFAPKPPEEILKERVSAALQAKVENRWGDFYEMTCMEYRKSIPKEKFVNMDRKMIFTGFVIKNIEIGESGKEAKVLVLNDFKFMGYQINEQKQIQKWVYENANWYLSINAKANPFSGN